MTKREFMIEYVLNRCLGNSEGLDGGGAAQSAAKAWAVIEKEAPEPVVDTGDTFCCGCGMNELICECPHTPT